MKSKRENIKNFGTFPRQIFVDGKKSKTWHLLTVYT